MGAMRSRIGPALLLATALFANGCGSKRAHHETLSLEHYTVSTTDKSDQNCLHYQNDLYLCQSVQAKKVSTLRVIHVLADPTYSIDGGMVCQYDLCTSLKRTEKPFFSNQNGILDSSNFPYNELIIAKDRDDIVAIIGFSHSSLGRESHIHVSKWVHEPYDFTARLAAATNTEW
jgi:hypothetical protein